MVDDYKLDKVLGRIKRIGIEKFDDNKIFINTDDKLPDGITLKNAEILMTCVIKDVDKNYPKLFLGYMINKHNAKHLKKRYAKI